MKNLFLVMFVFLNFQLIQSKSFKSLIIKNKTAYTLTFKHEGDCLARLPSGGVMVIVNPDINEKIDISGPMNISVDTISVPFSRYYKNREISVYKEPDSLIVMPNF